jgi:hypothetical protein
MASVDTKREKFQSPQNSVKVASSRREHRKISNGSNGLSNKVMNQKIFTVKVWSTYPS